MTLTFDPATFDHWADLFAWRNDPTTRNNSLDTCLIPLDTHLKWLKETLKTDNVKVFIARDPIQGTKVGMGRIEFKNQTTADISLAVAADQRGFGYGKQIIVKLTALAGKTPIIRADVREENLSSLRAFAACGYVVRKIKKTETGNIVELAYAPPVAA